MSDFPGLEMVAENDGFCHALGNHKCHFSKASSSSPMI